MSKKTKCGLMAAAPQVDAVLVQQTTRVVYNNFLQFLSSLFIRDWKLINLEGSQ